MLILRALADLVLPPRCPACHDIAPAGLCADCTAAAGGMLLDGMGWCRLDTATVAVAPFAYEGVVAQAIRTVKRPGRHAAATGLGALLWTVLDANLPVTDLPRTWVPATPAARRSRGAEIPRLLAGPGACALLRCPADRPDQTRLDARMRRSNPVGAFVATTAVPETIVVVDDVRTTGATLLAAAAALRAAGARRVIGVTFAAAGDEVASALRGGAGRGVEPEPAGG